MADFPPRILILGTRGIPAAHGGFETFAERLALFLVARGWEVGVYCQQDVDTVTRRVSVDRWRGIERINIEVAAQGPKATLAFDWFCVRDAVTRPGLCLVLGYNGAVFLPYLRLRGRTIVTNMDGIEWRRAKWNRPVRAWFWINEWIAALVSHRLIADHPRMADHLATRRDRASIVTIPYGADPIAAADPAPVRALGLMPDRYLLSVARIEPDNSILEMVQAFSRKARDAHLVVLGNVDGGSAYGRAVRAAASAEVVFPGPIYDAAILRPLRSHARAYMHGHTVGGTNPSLVEALWAGNAVIAHDNPFNRWTAGDAALFFADVDACEAGIEAVLTQDALVARARRAALVRAQAAFAWPDVLDAYESLFEALGAGEVAQSAPPVHAALRWS